MYLTQVNLPQDNTPQQYPIERITWKRLCKLEPRLLDLYERASGIRDDLSKPSFCANNVWYGRRGWPGLKPQLWELVGFGARRWGADPQLWSSLAYDIAYRKVYDALPDCRNCACWGFQELVDERLADEP